MGAHCLRIGAVDPVILDEQVLASPIFSSLGGFAQKTVIEWDLQYDCKPKQ